MTNTLEHEPTFVDARFAGGAVQVTSSMLPHDDTTAAVVLALPGHTVTLFPHEARALADALRAHAGGRE